MNVAKDSAAFKSIQEITVRNEALKKFVVQAATNGKSLYRIERGLLEQLLTIENHAINSAFILQGRRERSICGRSMRGLAYPCASVHS